jgi:NAD-dependent deacetylase
VRKIVEAHPNEAHIALAELEQHGYVHAIVTQNIDALHHRAGSNTVFEIHGHLREACCTSCFNSFETEELIVEFLKNQTIPRCPECDGVLKPNIVLFGEQLPSQTVRAAIATLDEADLLVVAGSSLQVTPAATFPIPALNRGAKLIIINHEPTYLDERASVIFHEDVAVILPLIAKKLLKKNE